MEHPHQHIIDQVRAARVDAERYAEPMEVGERPPFTSGLKPWPPRFLDQPGVKILSRWTWQPSWEDTEEEMVTVEYRGEIFDMALSDYGVTV